MQRNLSEELRRIYNCSPDELFLHTARYERLVTLYRSRFSGQNPAFIVRAPGRVNLIGEHTDYNGYPVMPMTIDRDVVFILGPRTDSTIDTTNESLSFERRTFNARLPVPPFEQGDWGNYVKAAVHGILEADWIDAKKAAGFQAVVGGTIPESAGLSSSSALVVASALAFLTANGKEIKREPLAELLARAERYVGSEGGGMDQAVSLLAETGKALKIDFFPLRTQPTSLPKNLSFVVCNSLIRAPKSESIRYAYNRRVIECRLATALVAKAVKECSGKDLHPTRLADLSGEKLGLEQRTIDKIVAQAIGEKPLSLKEISHHLGETTEAVQKRLCTLRDGSMLTEPPEGFKIWNRYKHVVTEAHRVELAVGAFAAGDGSAVGDLMNQSHASCRDDYEISCPELEALVSIGRELGALGARLTGAGFGGCTVNAVPSNQVARFVEGVTAAYYHGYVRQEKERRFTSYANLHDVIFVCRATTGAGAWPSRGDR
ncbi:MAG: galactokinase [Ignavibacteriales bacterium]|nr:galactokinase [Ignavibacteriales bacterium]